MTTSRAEVYQAIDTERNYQDSQWPGRADNGHNALTVGEFVLLMQDYVSQATAVWTIEPKPTPKTLDAVRKIAAVAVNCMEQNGAPMRRIVIFNDQKKILKGLVEMRAVKESRVLHIKEELAMLNSQIEGHMRQIKWGTNPTEWGKGFGSMSDGGPR